MTSQQEHIMALPFNALVWVYLYRANILLAITLPLPPFPERGPQGGQVVEVQFHSLLLHPLSGIKGKNN